MTLEKIDSLTFEDVGIKILRRLLSDSFHLVPENEEWVEADLTLHPALPVPTQEEIDAELTAYKAELRATEEARLAEVARVDAIKARWEAIEDAPYLLSLFIPSPINAELELAKIIESDDSANLLADLEVKDAQKKAEKVAEEAARPEKEMKASRDNLLSASDFTQLADAPFSSAEKTEWREYRQYLRDLPELKSNGQLQTGAVEFDVWKAWKDSLA